MKTILFNFPGHDQGKLFSPQARDACQDPYIHLRNELRKRGYELKTIDNFKVNGCAWVWFWNAVNIYKSSRSWSNLIELLKRCLLGKKKKEKRRLLYQEYIHAGLENRIVLFTGEPPTVLPQNWKPRVHKLFPIIFTWHDDYVDGKKFHKFYLPLPERFPDVTDIPFSQRKLLTNISNNKFSSHPRELYTARREAIRYFEHNYPEEFDLYGVNWDELKSNQAPYLSYRGTVQHKWDVYPYYQFGLCYENIYGEPGYVTEKIFDCMRAGCVPIYWGAPNITNYVDTEAFIDRRKFKSNAELADFLLSMSEKEHSRYKKAINSYLDSNQFKNFLSPAFADNIINVLSL